LRKGESRWILPDGGMAQMTLQQAFDLAHQHYQAARWREAGHVYRQILAQDPNQPDVLHLLGLISIQSGDAGAGIELIRQAIRINPQSVQYLNNLGIALTNSGQPEEAITVLSRSIQLKTDEAESHYNLANALQLNGQSDEAIAGYRRAIQLRSDHPLAHNNLGNMLYSKGQIDEAIIAYREALRLRPDHANSHSNLAAALRDKGRSEEAIVSCQRALQINPDHFDACNNLANALRDQGKFDEAIDWYERAIRLKPDFADAHFNLAIALLTVGNFSRGWAEYEWRWRWKNFTSPLRNFVQPQWDGQKLQGGTILLHAEQGFGDTLQFVRYVPEVAARAGNVILKCQHELSGLLRTFPGTHRVMREGEPLPAFDVHCPLLSLPRIFNTTLQTIPATVPYLKAADDVIGKWRPKVDVPAGHLRVGLAWAGSPTNKGDRTRSLHLESLALLGSIEGVTFFSLQKGIAGEQARTPPAGMRLVNIAPELADFSDTAAVMSIVDLVITADTAVAHLAGALGRPVWVLLQFLAEWRWLLDREDSPWYPTMRLFRQKSPGDWDDVIKRVTWELTNFSKQRSKGLGTI